MSQAPNESVPQDDHVWDAWFEDEVEPPVAPRRWRLARYLLAGIAIEAVVLVIALAAA